MDWELVDTPVPLPSVGIILSPSVTQQDRAQLPKQLTCLLIPLIDVLPSVLLLHSLQVYSWDHLQNKLLLLRKKNMAYFIQIRVQNSFVLPFKSKIQQSTDPTL